jgi:hypothetical protein
MASSFVDFYILYKGHPLYRNLELIEDDVVRVIIQKYEMILFTNKGEFFGDANFGADLYSLLYETRLSSESIESDITFQINNYIPEIQGISYTLRVEFYEDPENYQEIMTVYFTIAGYEVYAVVK